ncbi:hypothetical protein HMPREF0970_00181 [Schaalia odontolytica F0309]|uniref:WXG100 family type VII secretion target n=3 Tax=Schaalia odontolytica TaxID=1660 RepID=A0A857A9C8_9ACTO|nr:hypothetical protein HMPREF0970_00181 [Schaalia odontolytica F0309]QGS11931.1 hypothetical protein FOC40_09020 [Schaalia odontolytica]
MKEERAMSGPGFGLVVGAQTKAAGYVVDFETELADIADTLEADITGQLSHVNGTYVSILGEALTAWGEAGSPHVGDQDRYAQALISVDEALIAAEEQATEGIIDAGAFGSGQ